MTTPELDLEVEVISEAEQVELNKRRRLLVLLVALLLLVCCVGFIFVRYLLSPQPLPDLVPILGRVNVPPTYVYSITGVDEPVGVAISPDGKRIYVAESAGERLIKMFDSEGNLLGSFSPPGTTPANRKPAYLAVNSDGRVFVADTYNNVIAVFDADGNFLDGIIAKDVTLSEVITAQNGGEVPHGTLFYYNNITKNVDYQLPDGQGKSIPGPDQSAWSPLGLRFDAQGNFLVTNIVGGKHQVLIFSADDINAPWVNFAPQVKEFGVEGGEKNQFSYPNSAVTDSRGNFYISDGNNGRVSFWTPDMQYRTFFGFGSAESALNLPRGMWMDSKDRLHVADAIGQYIRVYDVSGEEPTFLYNFGVFGNLEGEFNYPTDICMDKTGRLYIADRENNRIQVWSY